MKEPTTGLSPPQSKASSSVHLLTRPAFYILYVIYATSEEQTVIISILRMRKPRHSKVVYQDHLEVRQGNSNPTHTAATS